MVATFIWVAIALALLVYVITLYNGLVNLKHAVAKAWANIDVLLKQRHDELPKLVDTCLQYMEFEKSALTQVMNARAGADRARESGDIKGIGQAEGLMRAGLGSIIATVEAYPELKANQAIQQLLGRITGLENAIADRREFYNEAVNINNVRIEEFPDVLVARLFGFKAAELLLFSEDETRDVDLRARFRS
jgi:LemA protein